MKDDYVRAATVVRIVDGDSVSVDVNLGFYVTVRMSCRLAGINAIELRSPGGSAAAAKLADLLAVGEEVTIQSIKPDKYAGRFDGVIFTSTSPDSVNDRMVASGYAARWDGHGAAPVPPWPDPSLPTSW